MTQIIGIICKDYILVASESQYTRGNKKILDAKKISGLRFKNNEGAIVAEGGATKNSNRAVHYMQELASQMTIDSEIAVAKIAELAMKQVREDILETMPPNVNQRAVFESEANHCGLLVAYYFNGKPQIYRIFLGSDLAERQSSFAVIGCDNDVSEFLLKRFQFGKMEFKETFPILIDALDMVSEDDKHCGGQIHVIGLSHKLNPLSGTMIPAIWSDDSINRWVKQIREARKRRDQKYAAECLAITEKIRKENLNRRMKAFVKKYPQLQGVAVGIDAVRKHAAEWNRAFPDNPIPIEEWLKNSPENIK